MATVTQMQSRGANRQPHPSEIAALPWSHPARLDPSSVALGELWKYRDLPRAEALDITIDYLYATRDMTIRQAESAAVQALAELESVNCRDVIDIASTTSNVLVLDTAEGERVALTVRDLRSLLAGQPLEEPLGEPVRGLKLIKRPRR